VESAKAAIKANDATRRKLEGEIQAQQQKISKYRDQSLEVKTNDQYKALLHEIQFAEREIRAAEDKILEGMVDSEAHEKELKTVEAELKQATVEIETEKAEARRRTEEDQRELATWQEKRQGLRSAISSEPLAHYDRVRRVRKSVIDYFTTPRTSPRNQPRPSLAKRRLRRPPTRSSLASMRFPKFRPDPEFVRRSYASPHRPSGNPRFTFLWSYAGANGAGHLSHGARGLHR
jgi:hypothetical protein